MGRDFTSYDRKRQNSFRRTLKKGRINKLIHKTIVLHRQKEATHGHSKKIKRNRKTAEVLRKKDKHKQSHYIQTIKKRCKFRLFNFF